MLRINPATALLLLTDIVALKPGDWIIQNVANSAVGRLVIRLARPRGVKTVNVVRRESLFGELKALGADVCVVDGPDLPAGQGPEPARRSIWASTPCRAGHRAALRMSRRRRVVCNYGSMTGEDPVMSRSTLSRAASRCRVHLGPRLSTRSRADPGDLCRSRPQVARATCRRRSRWSVHRGHQGSGSPRSAASVAADPRRAERAG